MSNKAVIEKEKIEQALKEALKTLLARDKEILRADINERTISHRLALYLEPYFGDWNVDCEYNRNHNDPKRLEIPRKMVRNDDTRASTVFPDIIIHKRDTNENLLVIEIKKTTSREKDDFDLHKLKAFRNQIGYKLAVFVKVPTGAMPDIEQIKWV